LRTSSGRSSQRDHTVNSTAHHAVLITRICAASLVMHARDDAVIPFDQGRRLAAGIPGARFVPLASRNHLILEDEPAFPRFLEEMRRFLAA
jgi:pimeloyl-ACP methyl ester carboxylesterase